MKITAATDWLEGNSCVYIGLHRLQSEKIVDHWEFCEKCGLKMDERHNRVL